MSSGFPSMFKTPKHRTFEYKPLIYDPQKERKAELEQLAEEYRTGQISDERRLQRLRGSFKGRMSGHQGRSRKQNTAARQVRLLIIMAVLLAAVAFFFHWA
jgi:hypothetical protein